MRFRQTLFTLFFICITVLAQGQKINAIIPHPASIEILQQGAFTLSGGSAIVCLGEGTKKSESYLRNYLREYYKITPKQRGKSNLIELKISRKEGAVEGAYTLQVTPDKIFVTGFNEQGLFYGVQTLIQLLPVGVEELSGRLEIPAVKIEDAPAFPYRGMHLDVVRHIFPVDYLKKYIDYIALHKMNHFHLHLTDDQGWRIESKSHPILNEKGAYRDATIIGIFPGTGVDSTRYGGFYTVKELKELVDYAAQRYITIVPEIDIPGHCMAILAAYPQFGTEPERVVKPAITWGIYNRQNNVLAPSKEVFGFLKDVYNELMDIFPGKYIHMGADECAHKWWKESEAVQQYIKENNLGDEDGLQRHFAQKVSDIITARGRIAFGWDEMVDHGLVDGVGVFAWRKEANGYKAAEQGHKVILTPSRYSYFNYKQRDDEERLAHMFRTIDLKSVYTFNPLPDSLSTTQRENILGGQGCIWTEYYATPEEVEYGIFPRMSAIAEVYWSQPKVKDYERFFNGMQVQLKRYELWGITPCYYEFTK